jgi:hypothetical protein
MTAARAQLAVKPSIMAAVATAARLGREAAARNREDEAPRAFVTRAVRAA